jgi:hypothetical protein
MMGTEALGQSVKRAPIWASLPAIKVIIPPPGMSWDCPERTISKPEKGSNKRHLNKSNRGTGPKTVASRKGLLLRTELPEPEVD